MKLSKTDKPMQGNWSMLISMFESYITEWYINKSALVQHLNH